VQQLVEAAKQFGLQSGACVFPADIVSKIDSPSVEDAVHIIGIYKVPRDLTAEEYGQKFNAFVENYVALPAIQKNLVKYELVRHHSHNLDPGVSYGRLYVSGCKMTL